jgi:hypothetical protein
MLPSENGMGCLWIVVWWLIELLQHIMFLLPSYSKILLRCLPQVSLEKTHPSLLETGPSPPNQKRNRCNLYVMLT